MDHELEAEVTLSGVPAPLGLVEQLVPELAAEALRKTVGQRGEGRLAKFTVDGPIIHLTLESSGARPHQALLALVRRLGEELGRRAKVGVRSFRAPRYRVRFPMDPLPKGPIGLPIPHEFTVEGAVGVLELRDLSEEGLRDNWVDRATQLLQEKAKRQAYEGKEQVLGPSEAPGRAGTCLPGGPDRGDAPPPVGPQRTDEGQVVPRTHCGPPAPDDEPDRDR